MPSISATTTTASRQAPLLASLASHLFVARSSRVATETKISNHGSNVAAVSQTAREELVSQLGLILLGL